MSFNNLKERRKKAKDKQFKKTIILLEHEGQVKNCLKLLKGIKGQKLIIALSPFAMYELDKQNLPYKLLEDYYDSKELYKLGVGNWKKAENLCGVIDGHIHNACPAIARLGIKPAMFSISGIKVLYDAATIRLFQLFKLIKAEKPDVILTYCYRQYPFRTEDATYPYFDRRESIYARLLTLHGWGVPIRVLPYVSHPEDSDVSKEIGPDIANKKKVMWWFQRHPKLFDLAVEIQRRGWRGLFSWLRSYLRAGTNIQVLLFGGGHNWDDCREQLQAVGIDPVFNRISDNLEYWMSDQFSDKADADALRNAWGRLRADDKFRKFFIWENIDFFPLVEEYLRLLVERLTPACLDAYEVTTKLLEKGKIKAFLALTLASCTSRSAAQAARNSNIPVVTWQHGAYGPMDYPLAIYADIMSSDFHFVFGEGVINKYKRAARKFGTRLVTIGSPSLEALFQMPPSRKVEKIVKLTLGKKVVLYASTNFYQNNLYVLYYPPPSDNHLWRTQRAILDVHGKHDDHTVVVKTHPTRIYRESPMRLYAKENKFKNCQFIRDECTFTDLLPIADLLVIDFPSTTLLQALTTSEPMFVYTGHLHLDTRAQKLLERRAFCYRELKSLVNALDRYLSTGKIDKRVDLNDREFLNAYGISSQGAGSRTRAAKTLKSVISGHMKRSTNEMR